jgi:hypothetical protein
LGLDALPRSLESAERQRGLSGEVIKCVGNASKMICDRINGWRAADNDKTPLPGPNQE